jgi:hypothetical protein
MITWSPKVLCWLTTPRTSAKPSVLVEGLHQDQLLHRICDGPTRQNTKQTANRHPHDTCGSLRVASHDAP